jgi:hypothetical protein
MLMRRSAKDDVKSTDPCRKTDTNDAQSQNSPHYRHSATGCNQKDNNVENYPHIPMIGAVKNSRTEKVRELAAKGIGLNERAPEV